MKKWISLLLCILLAVAAAGCGDGASSARKDESTESEVKEIDVDLTELSSTMVYSEVYNMMNQPADYTGKVVKMQGTFDHFHDEETNQDYFACIIQDATACCAQGIEFSLKGKHTFPDDYPEVGEEVTVTGVFDTYTEGESTYCTLREAAFD